MAQISSKAQGRRWSGYFETEMQAAMAYNAAAIEFFGPTAYLNRIDKTPSENG